MSAGDAAGSIRTLLVDDHPVVRYGVRHILDSEDDIEVVGELDGIGGIGAAIESARPDVVLLDLELGEIQGVEALRQSARLRRNSRSSSTPRTTKRTTSSRRRNWEWTATC